MVTEVGTREAVSLLQNSSLAAPDRLMAECVNILRKKVRRKELSVDEALMAARLLVRADVEISPTRHLLETAARIAIELDHPAYDCIYLGLAITNNWRFVTADTRLLNKLGQAKSSMYAAATLAIPEAAAYLASLRLSTR
jgi:predicted nucleic acid-binding protein